MTRRNASLITFLILILSAPLGGCDATARLTEQEHIERAKDFEDKDNLKGSIIELKNAILKNPDSPQARLLLGQVYLKVGMGAEAEKELAQAKKLGVSQETLNPHLGEALLLMGEPKRVLDEIRPGEQTSPANRARILQLRGDALLRLGQLKDGCSLYQQSLAIDTNHPPTYWGLAQCAVAERDTPKARAWLDAALKVKDRRDKTWVFLGELEQINGKPEEALAAYTNALKIEPENLEALRSRAAVNIGLSRFEPAQVDIEKIRKLAPNSFVSHYLQALLKSTEKKYPEARDALQSALKISPDNISAHLLGGSIEFALGNLQTAESHLNKVVRAAPRNGFARRMLAITQLRQGRPDDAEKTVAPLDMAKVRDAGIFAIAGEIALAKKEHSKAVAYFEKAVELSPENAALRTELGMIRLTMGDDRAMADFQAAAGLGGANNRADNIIILSQLKQGQYDAALDSIAALEKKQTQTPLTLNYRGAAYLGKNDVAKARNSFEQALKLDPKFFPAAATLAKLDFADGQPGHARKRFERILKAEPTHLQAMLAMAGLAASEKNEKDYQNWLEKAAKADPTAIEPSTNLVQFHLTKKENQKALALARGAANANPDNLQAISLLGRTQLAVGDHAAAIATFNRMTLKAPQSPEAHLRLAQAQMADKQLADARESLKKAIQIKPDYLEAQEILLRLELADNQPEAALKIARQIQSQQPKSPLGFEREADILLLQKRYREAIKAYEHAQAKGSGTAGLIKLHRAHLIAGYKNAADQPLTDWIKQHPKDMAARSYAAEAYMLANRNRDAITQYQELLKSDPSNLTTLNNLANLYQREKDSRALVTAEQALKLAPEHPAVQDTLGWILLDVGQLPRATELLSKAAGKDPESGSIRYHYGVALARSGRKAEARKELGAAIASGQKFPELEEAKSLLKSL